MSMTVAGHSGLRQRWFHRHPRITLAVVGGTMLVLVALLFELFFRGQYVDMYATELRAFNPPARERSGAAATVLALGDSFTAGLDTYPHWLQEQLGNQWTVVNGGVPGTTVRQASLVLGNRLSRFCPRVVVYQTYVGNDLLDLSHPVSWRRVHPLRNGYWVLSDLGWTSLGFLNYRLGQIKNRFLGSYFWDPGLSTPERLAEIEGQDFSMDRYRRRECMLLAADPWIIERQIGISGAMEQGWRRYSRSLKRLTNRCRRDGIPVVVLVVPHCVQVHQRYRDRFEVLGARFEHPSTLSGSSYPFVAKVRRAVEDGSQVVVLDSLHALRNAENAGQSMYLNNDDHLSVAGQQILSRLLAEEIVSASNRESTDQDGR